MTLDKMTPEQRREFVKGLNDYPEVYDRYVASTMNASLVNKILTNAEAIAQNPALYDRLVQLELEAKRPQQVAKLHKAAPRWDTDALHRAMMPPTIAPGQVLRGRSSK